MTIQRRRYSDDSEPEETPLLQGKAKTPVPWGQLSLAFLVLAAETISSEYTNPFINKLIGELGITGGDDRKIGYYLGLMEFITHIIEVFSTWQWSRSSDFIGRRPVVLIGLLSLVVSCCSFGLSRSFGLLVFSRCLSSVLDGNNGVVMSILGESTDSTSMAQVFAISPAVVCIAIALGSFYGGALAKPQERWPHTFQGKFWATYPYFLPSFVTAIGILSVFFICAMFLKETLPSKLDKRSRPDSLEVVCPEEHLRADGERPVSILVLLTTYSVMLPIANSALYGVLNVGCCILIPLFYSSPIGIGGLGLSPPIIGSCWGTFAIVEGIVQALLAPKIIAWFGPKKALYFTVPWMFPLILLFPAMSAVVTAQGRTGVVVWILLVAQLVCMTFVDMSYIMLNMFLTRAAPNKQSLGSVNGLSQSLMSIARAVGALTASLFAFSKQYGVLGGNFVYVVMAVLATVTVALSRCLPDLEEDEAETDEWTSGGSF